MNGHYWIEKALKELSKSENRGKIATILVKYFDQAMEHTLKDAEEAFHELMAENEKLRKEIYVLKASISVGFDSDVPLKAAPLPNTDPTPVKKPKKKAKELSA